MRRPPLRGSAAGRSHRPVAVRPGRPRPRAGREAQMPARAVAAPPVPAVQVACRPAAIGGARAVFRAAPARAMVASGAGERDVAHKPKPVATRLRQVPAVAAPVIGSGVRRAITTAGADRPRADSEARGAVGVDTGRPRPVAAEEDTADRDDGRHRSRHRPRPPLQPFVRFWEACYRLPFFARPQMNGSNAATCAHAAS